MAAGQRPWGPDAVQAYGPGTGIRPAPTRAKIHTIREKVTYPYVHRKGAVEPGMPVPSSRVRETVLMCSLMCRRFRRRFGAPEGRAGRERMREERTGRAVAGPNGSAQPPTYPRRQRCPGTSLRAAGQENVGRRASQRPVPMEQNNQVYTDPRLLLLDATGTRSLEPPVGDVVVDAPKG